MNQDQVKKKLLELDSDVEDFTVTFTGKSSKKVDGLYKPDRREMLLHTENFTDDNQLMFTAIHEFAHHIQFTKSHVPVYSRAHTVAFRQIFHRLLVSAEEKGVYVNIFNTEKKFLDLTRYIKENFLAENGKLMMEFGEVLIKAYNLCLEYHASFEDYVDRALGFNKSTASSLIRIQGMNLNPSIGYENMKTVARIKDLERREMAQDALLEGQSPELVKAEYISRKINRDDQKLEFLYEEKLKIQKNIETLSVKLTQVELKIEELERN